MSEAKALQFVAPGQVQLVQKTVGSPGAGEVAIRMLASSMCNHPEVWSFRGGQPRGYGSRYPMAPGEPGHEGVGEIAGIGEGVQDLAVGDLVVMTGIGGDATHASHVLRRAEAVAQIDPGDRDPRPASILEMFGCAYHCVRVAWQQAGGYDNARVAVVGVGAIGLCSVQIMRCWPVRAMVALDVSQAKLEVASRLGATETVLVPPDVAAEDLARKLGRFDVVAECSGRPGGHLLASAMAPRVLINVSYCPTPFPVHQGRWFAAGTTVYNPGILSSGELRAVANLYNRGLIDPEALISRRIRPEPEAYLETIRQIEAGHVIKALIEWDEP